MDWKEKIKKGLELIKEGCANQDSWSTCHECPFYDYCTAFDRNDFGIVPCDWELEK